MAHRDLMIDLESLGVGRDAVIVSMAAVAFDLKTGEISDTFTMIVDLDQDGGVISPSTVQWWMTQPEEVRRQVTDDERAPLSSALQMFFSFYRDGGFKNMWSNGPTFDEMILRDAYARLGLRPPFHWRHSRCCRTIRELAKRNGVAVPPKTSMQEREDKHDPLADCLYQIRWVCDCYRHLVRVEVVGDDE